MFLYRATNAVSDREINQLTKVLITGIAGFIGSALARALLSQGAYVRGLDNLSTGAMINLDDIFPSLDFTKGSVEDIEEVARACHGIDFVLHQAAVPSVPASVSDPLGTHGANLCGTLTVLEAARHAGVKRLLYASSAAAYGSETSDLPKNEAMLPSPMSPYAVQKLAGEYYLAAYAKLYGLETVALRYFNVFGPRQDPSSQYSGVLARFVAQMGAGECPTIFGDGSTSRDFTYVDDVVSANLLAMTASAKVSGKVFNVATGTSTTLLQAVDAIRTATGYQGLIKFLPERRGDIRHSLADITRAQQMLGYRARTNFSQGLSQTVAWSNKRSRGGSLTFPSLPPSSSGKTTQESFV